MIGGFLGAGKTTSVIELAKYLEKQGRRVGVITNDQAENLVDTQLVKRSGFDVKEIAGGCFCCRFSSLKDAADHLTKESRPDVFIAEPVGSCTDLIATVSYPLRRMYGNDFEIAPLSVLLDPQRALKVFGLLDGKRFSHKIEYIYKKQIEEAQVVVINKIDSIETSERQLLEDKLNELYVEKTFHWVSAKTGEGLEEWFETVTQTRSDVVGQKSLEIDYKEYAEGEALLAWMNASLEIQSEEEFDGNQFMEECCQFIHHEISALKGQVAHLKLTLKPDDDEYEMASIQVVDNDKVPELGLSLSDDIESGELIVNARAEMDPADLKLALEKCIAHYAKSDVTLKLKHMDHFAPAEPVPEYRLEVGHA